MRPDGPPPAAERPNCRFWEGFARRQGGHPDLIPACSVSIFMTLRAMGTYQDATRIERGRTLRAQTAMLSRVTREERIGLLHLPGTAGSTSALLPSSSLSGAEW